MFYPHFSAEFRRTETPGGGKGSRPVPRKAGAHSLGSLTDFISNQLLIPDQICTEYYRANLESNENHVFYWVYGFVN